jgi:putative membrane protein
MQSQHHRTRVSPVLLFGSLCALSLFTSCAACPPFGPLDFGLAPGLGPLLMIVLLVAVVFVIATHARRSSMPASDDSALSLLRDRYARGEIDHEDFLQRRRDLEGNNRKKREEPTSLDVA